MMDAETLYEEGLKQALNFFGIPWAHKSEMKVLIDGDFLVFWTDQSVIQLRIRINPTK
jgi:hypothetical protein